MDNTPEQPGKERSRVCPQCGSELPPGIPATFCPKCLLAAAMESKPPVGKDTVPLPVPPPIRPNPSIEPGQTFGHYRIIREAGGGGMGTVYEAEDLDTNRRIALKVLSHKLDSPEARERFFREGRLAASINHPNSVYIFGTEEIAGTPVISMELLAGGTLQDKVRAKGPIPPGEAVDAVLQIIDGLEAAQRAGILHRDIKPSNCFVDPDGLVKIGDFGLSISTAVRIEPALTADGAFLGTPAFCPPEQLRGEELNARSDIYSVGATLFYLLTGRTPFEAQNVVALIATVLEKPAPSVRAFRPAVSHGLDRVVQRCLEKVREDRFANYTELRRALEPYSSAAPVPAPLGLRFATGALDMVIVGLLAQMALLLSSGSIFNLLDMLMSPSPKSFLFILGGVLFTLLYYAIPEGLFGRTIGKAICRLRVIVPNRQVPGIPRALVRAFVYMVLPVLPFWIYSFAQLPGGFRDFFNGSKAVFWPEFNSLKYQLMAASPYLVMALLFITARKRNGWRAAQDFLSGTSVIVQTTSVQRLVPSQPEETEAPSTSTESIGPYRILQTLGEQDGRRWLVGFDLRLLRKVWIRQLPPGAEPVPAWARNLGRPGRLRWLTGKRSAEENWDAFEAPGGQAFLSVVRHPQPWEQVRFWLWDLALELAAAKRDHTEPAVLALDRVWMTKEGKMKLLDFPAPGATNNPSQPESGLAPPNSRQFLAAVAIAALNGTAEVKSNEIARPTALYVRKFVSDLSQIADVNEVLTRLAPILRRPARVTRLRRAALVLGCVAFPLFTVLTTVFGMSFVREMDRRYPDLLQVHQTLSLRSAMRFTPRSERIPDRDIALYLAAHHREFITNKDSWNSPFAKMMISGNARRFAEAAVRDNPSPSPEELKRVGKKLQIPKLTTVFQQTTSPLFLQMSFFVCLSFYVGVPAFIAAVLFRGGLVLLAGRVTYVRADGRLASRWRIIWRSILTWLPAAAGLVAAGAAMTAKNAWVGVSAAVVLLILTVISLVLRDRGLQDRLTGTWPVIR